MTSFLHLILPLVAACLLLIAPHLHLQVTVASSVYTWYKESRVSENIMTIEYAQNIYTGLHNKLTPDCTKHLHLIELNTYTWLRGLLSWFRHCSSFACNTLTSSRSGLARFFTKKRISAKKTTRYIIIIINNMSNFFYGHQN